MESLRTRVKLLEDVQVYVNGQPKTMAEIEEHVKSWFETRNKKESKRRIRQGRSKNAGITGLDLRQGYATALETNANDARAAVQIVHIKMV